MSLQLSALSLFLRLVNKPGLARASDLSALRARLERIAPLVFRAPPGAVFAEEAGPPHLLWARVGETAPGRAILYLHGGGFVMGSPRTHRHLAAALAGAAGAAAALPFYRLAPEHPHPAALDDAQAAYAALSGRGLRVALAGDSAGGGLAFALVGAIRAAGLPDPVCVVGFSPWCDMTMRQPSLTRNARAEAMLPISRMAEVIAMRMGAGDPRDPAASPVFARHDRPPPPALILASRAEALEDDARAMAAVWRDAGGDARLELSPDAPHAWPVFVGLIPEADAAVARAGAFIAENFTRTEAAAP